jgi:hypothetical protein
MNKTACKQSLRQYLRTRMVPSGMALLLAFFTLYSYFRSGPPRGWIVTGLATLLLCAPFRLSRRWYYGLTLALLIAFSSYMVWGVANRGQDRKSDRDDAVEIAASALLHGENPWSERSILNLPITTGPSTILAAIPSALLTGHVNLAAQVFWLVLFGILLAGDLANRNNRFMLAAMVMLYPRSGFLHTQLWSLEELYYPMLLYPLLWWAVLRDRPRVAGSLAALILLGRLSYLFPLAAFAGWACFRERDGWRFILHMVPAAIITVGVVLLPFLLVGGEAFWSDNFIRNAINTGGVSEIKNPLCQLQAWLHELPAAKTILSISLLGVLAGGGFLLRGQKPATPFWHMAAASLLAHTVIFLPQNPGDYILLFMIPALFAISFSKGIQNSQKI